MWVAFASLFVVGALAAQISPAPPRQQTFTSDCSADGTVVNGLTGQALRRANVTVSSTNGSGTSTDPEGKWTISNITCGPVVFNAEKDGYVPNSYGRAKQVILASGSGVHDLKIELMPEAVVTGKVLDDAGDPTGSAQVRAMRSVVQNGRRVATSAGSANTDSTGAYRLGGLGPGRYFFCAISNRVRFPVGGGPQTIYGESCFPGPVSSGAGGGLRIEGGQEVHADFTLSQLTGAHVRGTVTGLPAATAPNGNQGTMIQMFRTEANGSIPAPGAVRPQQVKNGAFDFPNVSPGSYTLRANTSVAGEVLFANAFIDVGGTDVEGVTLAFQPGAPVSGTVRIENGVLPATPGAGHPADTSVNPVVNVNLNPVGISSPTGRVQWDSEHKAFSFPDVQAGKYRINVNVAGGGYFIKSVRLHQRELRNQEFTVDGPAGPIEIVIGNESGTLQGTVNDSDGKPAASQIVLQCGDVPPLVGHSQEDGAFTMRNIPAGECKAWAFDFDNNAEYADEDWMRRYAGSGAEVTITNGSAAQVTLARREIPQ